MKIKSGPNSVAMAIKILTYAERKKVIIVMIPVVFAALSSAMTIGSIMPFLSVLSDPNKLNDGGYISGLYQYFGKVPEYQFLLYLGLASVSVIIVSSIANLVRIYAVWKLTTLLIHSLSCRLLEVFLRKPYEFYLEGHTGDMATSVLSECEQLIMQVYKPVADLFASILTVLAIMGVVIFLSPVIALSAIILLGIVYFCTFGASRRVVQRLGRVRIQANNERYRIAGEALNGIKDVKILGREAGYLDRFEKPSQRIAAGRLKANVISEMPRYVVEAVSLSGIIILCLIMVKQSPSSESFSAGNIIPLLGVFAFAAQRLIPELQRSYAALNKLQYGAAGIHKIYSDLENISSLSEIVYEAPRPLRLNESLCAENIVHQYKGASRTTLSDVSFCIEQGERIGLVGGSGSGKTTLADVILGLLTLDSGRLLVDGVQITRDNVDAWRRSVGYVPQDIFLTAATVAENIALGVPLPEIDMQKVRKSADVANLSEIVDQDLPNGFKTKLGERGTRLSGGQRQRVGIARALYHDADLIIFDEATSALDNITEAEVVDAINRLPGTKTIIVIAHRLSTVRECDRIMVMDRGIISGFGTWNELLENNLSFRKLVGGAEKNEDSESKSS